MKQRYKITLAYDGTDYSGWQIQPHQRTIQGELENALREISGEKVRAHASGRTDQGVHAKAQVVHCDLLNSLEARKSRHSLNAILDRDIRITSIEKASPDFHARLDAAMKEYRYFIWNGNVVPPFIRRYRHHISAPLDVEAMISAAHLLAGKHDFAAFAANPRREQGGTVRHLSNLKVRKHGREISIIALGDGFLYKMVRSLAGFLIRVGIGELTPEDANKILNTKIRTAQVPTAPPQGLFLWGVSYSRSRPSGHRSSVASL